MPSPELVSALVPAYQHEPYVIACLDGIRAQTYPRVELVIGDDASRDGTAEAIASYVARHRDAFDRVVFVRAARNGGTAAMLNTLLGRARGAYLFLNASDDRAAPHAIETLVRVAQADSRIALAVGDSTIIDASGRRVLWNALREPVSDPADAAFLTWVDYLRAVNRPGVFEPRLFGSVATLRRHNYLPNGKLLRRSAVTAVGGWRSGVLEDWDLNFRLATRFRLRYVDEVLFSYRVHETNTMRDGQRVAILDQATRRAIEREMRRPSVFLRSLAHRDVGARVRAWARRARDGPRRPP